MRYCIQINRQQDEQLKKLEADHEKIINSTDNLEDLIREFVKEIRSKYPEIIQKLYIYPVFECINQIRFSFKEYKNAKAQPIDAEDADKKELAMLLVFFLNAKAFLELTKKYTRIEIDNDLLIDIKKIRDLLVHFYEKEIDQRNYFIKLSIERGLRDLAVLELQDRYEGNIESEIQFSLDLFYFSIKDIFEKLKNDPKLLK